jgi:hypothetical protein
METAGSAVDRASRCTGLNASIGIISLDVARIVRCRTMRRHATFFQGVRMETVTKPKPKGRPRKKR